ncbi:hypothetical protein NM208_g3695 [Fusarium decemcellulare]|uniref:Uncharacterized protein n=1 Tax=Fusarium decemcellulare TaxID=57161 RepID=A0ACC1SNI1_9HYPO|nr:hypothetical protein NM208_g3695 [Fusarium decemcellulare]
MRVLVAAQAPKADTRLASLVPDFLKAAANSLHDDVAALREAGKEPVFIPDNSHYNDQFLFIGANSEIPSVVEAREKHMPDFVERDPPDKRWRGIADLEPGTERNG